jgi:hypothetical protein
MATQEFEYTRWRRGALPKQALDEDTARIHFGLSTTRINRGIELGRLTVLAIDRDGLRLLDTRELAAYANLAKWYDACRE